MERVGDIVAGDRQATSGEDLEESAGRRQGRRSFHCQAIPKYVAIRDAADGQTRDCVDLAARNASRQAASGGRFEHYQSQFAIGAVTSASKPRRV